jgi:4-hydroxy-3-methylbut-2-enyl diphosphate reductase
VDEMITKKQILTLGITAGASSPQILVDEICEKLIQEFPKVKMDLYPSSREDSMNFKIPKTLIQID